MASDAMVEEGLTRDEAKRILRRLELDAYSSVITAFRAQGDLNRERKQALSDLAAHLSISNERHRAEVRRVVNDDSLNSISECLHGTGTATEWSSEGKRLVSLTPRLVPQTVFTAKATHTANAVSHENSKLPAKKCLTSMQRDRSIFMSNKTENFDEKCRAKDRQSPEQNRNMSAAVVKLTDSEKVKKKKKQSQGNNKAMKPNKLNLQAAKPDFRGSSSSLLSRNLLTPTSSQKAVSPENPQGTFHQKPIILQRSPQKTPPTTRCHPADTSTPSQYAYNTKSSLSTVQSISSVAASSSNQQHALSFDSKVNSGAANILIKSSQGLTPTSNTYIVQKMKFKTPVAKSKGKQGKAKPSVQLQRPSNLCPSHSADSLNLLAASTVVPMAPISPVKPIIPSTIGQSIGGSSLDASEENANVKVVQMQKSTNSSAGNSASKSFVVVSSATNAKAGNAQRVLALGNVPISGNQQLKIASIPNVLQQSGAKIVSIAKSMPMTTGFKMIAVTTVVPGSTQVKTVYIATPIMSVTKTSSQSHAAGCNQSSATKLLQTLVSGSSTSVRPAQTDVSPSNTVDVVRPSTCVVDSKVLNPVTTSNANSFVKKTVPTSVCNVLSTSVTSTCISTSTISSYKKDTGGQSSKLTSSDAKGTVEISDLQQKEDRAASLNNSAISASAKAVNKENALHANNVSCKEVVKDTKSECSRTNEVKSNENSQADEANAGGILSRESSESTDETILLAGEKFLAELAARFSKNNTEVPSVRVTDSDAEKGSDMLAIGVIEEKLKNAVAPSKGNFNSDFSTRLQVRHEGLKVSNPVDSKVIVRKIGEEYKSSPLKLCHHSEIEREELSPINDKSSSLVSAEAGRLKGALPVVLASQHRKYYESGNLAQSYDVQGARSTEDMQRLSKGSAQTVKFNCNLSSKDLNSKNDVKLPDTVSKIPLHDASGIERSGALAVGDQPRNVFSSFLPTNGNDEEEGNADSKHQTGFGPSEDPPSTRMSPEHCQLGSSSKSSPLFSDGFPARPANHKQTPAEEVDSSFENESLGEKSHIMPLPFPRQGPTPVTLESPEKFLSASRELSTATTLGGSHANDGQCRGKVSYQDTTTIVQSNSPLYSLNLQQSNSVLSSVNRRGSLPSQTDIEPRSGNEANDGGSFLDSFEQPFTNRTGDVLEKNENEVIFDKKLLKHSPRLPKSSTRSSKLDSIMVHGDGTPDHAGNSSTGLNHNKDTYGRTSHVVVADLSRNTSKKRKAEYSSVLSVGWIKGALTLLQRVSRFRGPNKQKGEMNAASWFTRPVDPAEAPGYYKLITQPMDFSTVRKKLEGGAYKKFTEFYSDMLLIKANCYMYNPAEHTARKDCDLVFKFFEEECYKLAQKQPDLEESQSKKSKVDVVV